MSICILQPEKIRQRIFNACRNGDYVAITPMMDSLLRGSFLSSKTEVDRNRAILIEQKKRAMFEEYLNIITRYPGLLVGKIPPHASFFISSPRYPVSLCFSTFTSGIINVFQILFVIHPIRKVYLHSRWMDGVPSFNSIDDMFDKEIKFLHEAISALFYKMIPMTTHQYYPSSYEDDGIGLDIIGLRCISKMKPVWFLNFILSFLTNDVIYKHPAFEKVYKRTFTVSYVDNENVVRERFTVPLHVDLFHENVVQLKDLIYAKSFHKHSTNISEFLTLSEYVIFTISYDHMRTHNICHPNEELVIRRKDETFDLVAAIYSKTSSPTFHDHFTIAKYGFDWYLINSLGSKLINFKEFQKSMTPASILKIVVYKKRILLNLK
jgi:hypothetical protein